MQFQEPICFCILNIFILIYFEHSSFLIRMFTYFLWKYFNVLLENFSSYWFVGAITV